MAMTITQSGFGVISVGRVAATATRWSGTWAERSVVESGVEEFLVVTDMVLTRILARQTRLPTRTIKL